MELAAVADHSESSQYRAAYDDDSESQREAAVSSLEVTLESTVDNIARIVLRLDLGSRRKEIKFPFDLESDTAESVAIEMVKELDLQESASGKLAEVCSHPGSTLVFLIWAISGYRFGHQGREEEVESRGAKSGTAD